MAEKCKECGCICVECVKNDENHAEMHLHVEIEHLRERLLERDSHIVTMETQFLNEADKFPNGELASMKEEMLTWQEKYARLYEAHKRVQKVNQNLEDKLLRIVDKCETEKSAFTKDIATLSHRLADANYTIHRLTQDNEKYRNDVNLAIQLLQCKPSNFVSQRYDSLPSEVQAKVRTYVAQKRSGTTSDGASPPDVKSITVPISTFPPTAMVYNITKPSVAEKDSDDEDSDASKPPVDIVSAAIMAKVLEERERERVFAKHCDTCTCHRSILTNEVQTQTDAFLNNYQNNVESTLQALSSDKGTSLQYLNEKPFAANNIRNSKTANNTNGNYALISDGLNQLRDSAKKGNQSPMRQATFNNTTSSDKAASRQTRTAKKSEPQSVYRLSKAGQPAKYKPLPSTDVDFTDLLKPRRQIDVINDRIWKNDWSVSSQKSETIDVINDRAWKTADSNITVKPRLTLIEVKPLAVDSQSGSLGLQQSDSRLHQSEDTASPSFSSDSLVISSSDPPSSSSDAVSQLGNNKTATVNANSSVMSNWQDRTAGPRGCSMRITPGSKNILLDNAGNYQTVLYTSSAGGRPSAALVHAAKSNKSQGSGSSEENSPVILPSDNAQLQRVAEWIKASGPGERPANAKASDDMTIKTLHNALSKIRSEKKLGGLGSGRQKVERLKASDKEQNEDLICFDSPVDERGLEQFEFTDVKVTREMEETYLKLAASLDPDNLEFSSSESADITIEKYRREYRRTHGVRQQDKTPGPAS